MESTTALVVRIVLCIALLAGCFAVIASIAVPDFKKANTSVYRESLSLARSDARLADALGPRLHRDWLIKGPFSSGDPSFVRLEYGLVGRRGRATIRLEATASPNRPTLVGLTAEIKETGEMIRLVPF